MEKVIKNMNVKPLLERAEYEKLDAPQKGATVNLRVGDSITVVNATEEIVKVSVGRTVASSPETIFKIYVEMSAEVHVDKVEYAKIINKDEFFKTNPIVRMLVSQIATVIANLTTNSAIGPMITVPMFQN